MYCQGMQPMAPGQMGYGAAPGGAAPAGNPGALGGILVLVAALMILVGVSTRSWFTMEDDGDSMKAGLTGYSICFSSGSYDDYDDSSSSHTTCKNEFFAGRQGTPKDIYAVGYLGFLLGLGSAGCAAIAGIMGLTKKAASIPVVVFAAIAGVALAAHLYYVMRVFTEFHGERHPSLGYSMFLAVVGGIGALVLQLALLGPAGKKMPGGAGMVPTGYYGGGPMQGGMPMPMGGGGMPMQQQQPAPMQQPLAQQFATPQPQAQTCPRCRGALTFVQQYQRWYCQQCQQYV
jgi:hypothetical protein